MVFLVSGGRRTPAQTGKQIEVEIFLGGNRIEVNHITFDYEPPRPDALARLQQPVENDILVVYDLIVGPVL